MRQADSESKEALRGNSKPKANMLSAKTITDISQNRERINLLFQSEQTEHHPILMRQCDALWAVYSLFSFGFYR